MIKKNVKISEVVGLLERLSIKKYEIRSHTYIKSNSAIRLEKITDYYKVVKKLKSKSVLMQGPRSLTYHLESNYIGCLFEITPDTTNSKIESMINKLKRENLLME